ncbi:hypothetical protein FEP16_04467 [Burkholderia multivorans]|nr:hypothetical protein [Burkholderia multivorans]
MCVGIDRAFEHELGRGRHADPVTRRAHELQRRAEQPARDRALVDAERHARSGGQHEQRMRADHHRDLQRIAARLRRVQHPPQMAARMQARRKRIARGAHRAVIAEVRDARFRIFRDDHRVRHVRTAIGFEVADHRQLREIDRVAFEHAIEHGPVRYDDRRDRRVRAPLPCIEQIVRVDAEQPRDACARRKYVRDERHRETVDALADEHVVPPARRERRDDGRHVLVRRQRLREREYVVGVMRAIGVREVMKVLLLGEKARRHDALRRIRNRNGRTARACVRRGPAARAYTYVAFRRFSASARSFGGLVGSMPTSRAMLLPM